MMSDLTLQFEPIATLPDDVIEAIVRGGKYSPAEAWRDDNGRWWIGRSCEIEIIGPTEWARIPDAPEPEPKPAVKGRMSMVDYDKLAGP